MSASIPGSTLEKFTTFGDLLRFLRRRVGMTQTELSIAVGYSTGQISRLEQNLRLPDIPTLEARFVPALDLENEPKAITQLLELAAKVRREDAPAPGLCPYKGLNYFDEPDADLFVGREQLTVKLAERALSLASNSSSQKIRFLAVVGASGSGKSSLVRAGLIPALRWDQQSADWQIHILTPTVHPLESLAANMNRESNSVSRTATLMDDLQADVRSLHLFAKQHLQPAVNLRILLVVDQFEELFALCRSEAERLSFIGNLLTAASEADGPVIVVITLRADYYAHCANYPNLREALAQQQEYIGSMNRDELCRAIEEPARRGRWELEPGLVELFLHDVGQEPGALPLLSHALLETWERRRGRTLTLGGYASSGGVRGAIAETAETVFTDQFTPNQQAIARRIFLRLTELNDETSTADTRRRAKLDELILRPEETGETQVVLKALADARLITTSENMAEVAHEALIREWPTLRSWLQENREDLRLQRQLTEAAQEWQAQEKTNDLLFRGVRLAQVREWTISHEEEINQLERDFVAASDELSQRESAEREAQHQRELEAAQKLAETERLSILRLRGRNRIISIVGLVALVLAVLAGIFGVQSAQNASAAQAANTKAIANFTHSEAQRLALEANNLMLNNGDPDLIALLALRSLAMQYTASGDAVLTSLTGLPASPVLFEGHTDGIQGVALSPDGKYLATGSADKTTRLWNVASGKLIHVLAEHTGGVAGLFFSPDGRYLWTGDDNGISRLWDVTSGQTLKTLSVGGYFALSPDLKYIVGPSASSTVSILDTATGKTVQALTGSVEGFTRVAISPDEKYVIVGGRQGAFLWDAMTGKRLRVFPEEGGCTSVAFTPDGKYVALGNEGPDTVQLYDTVSWQLVREFTGHQAGSWVAGIAFTPDGKELLSVSGDGTARLWDVSTGQFIHYVGGRGGVHEDVAISQDGRWVAISENGVSDFVTRVWDLQKTFGGVQFIGHDGAVYQASFSPNGRFIVTSSADHTARIWNTATGQSLITLSMNGNGDADELRGAIFSPDGKYVLTTGADGTARLWDPTTGKELRQFAGHTDVSGRAAFSPDGKYIVTTSYDGTARVWDTQTGQTILVYRNQGPKHVNRVAFSPDGKRVVTSGDDGTARIWNPLTGKDLMVFHHSDGVTGVAFSADGKELVTGDFGGTVHLWDVGTGKEIRNFTGHTGNVFGTAFSPDSKYVLSSGQDATARLWDVQTGQEVRRFSGHTGEIRNITFSPDGKYILTASNDGTARLWLTDLDDTIHAVCSVLTRDLTAQEHSQFGISDQKLTCPPQ